MIAVADVNTAWRSKPFEALSVITPVLALAPQDPFAVWRARGKVRLQAPSDFNRQVITMPPGWASRWKEWAATYIWHRMRKQALLLGTRMQGLVVTSPHYLELVKKASPHLATFYYCSDDYTQYAGWGGGNVSKDEAQLVRTVRHSFFVSQVLADRAVRSYGVSADRVSVSPNATDLTALDPVDQSQIEDIFRAFPTLRRPLVGVIGGINDRLDFEAIVSCADLAETGSLVLVGGVDKGFSHDILDRLRSHPKCVFAGQQPHSQIPVWMQALDVALIPYRDTPLNRACSPMRLYDHLAAGKTVVASEYCEQVHSFGDLVHIRRGGKELVNQVAVACGQAAMRGRDDSMLNAAKLHTWDVRARKLADTFL
jgi:teichuronic acid biosynthesis glycosyltransferase TuaH